LRLDIADFSQERQAFDGVIDVQNAADVQCVHGDVAINSETATRSLDYFAPNAPGDGG